MPSSQQGNQEKTNFCVFSDTKAHMRSLESKTTCASRELRSSEVTLTIKPICFQSVQTSCAAIPLSFQQQTLIIVLSLSSKDTSITQPHWLASKSRRRLCQAVPLRLCTLFAIKKTSRRGLRVAYRLVCLCICEPIRTFHAHSRRDFEKKRSPHNKLA